MECAQKVQNLLTEERVLERKRECGGRGGGKPDGVLGDAVEKEFWSYERFMKEFSQAAITVEGSGWAALSFCRQTGRPIIMQVEQHNVNIYPMFEILMVLDVFEHASTLTIGMKEPNSSRHFGA